MRHPHATRRVSVRSWRELLLLGFAACFLLMIGIVTIRSNGDGTTGSDNSRIQRHASRDYTSLREVAPEGGKTLVIYVYHESNAMNIENLQFFMDVAIGDQPTPNVDYILVLNGESSLQSRLRRLPKNVRVIQRENSCFDGGTVGVILKKEPGLWRQYQYFILLNSSVRGPFLPKYYPTSVLSWTTAFTSLINDEVKLVGTTISCEGQLHVQSMVLATDRVGLQIIKDAGALECQKTLMDAINNYERTSSSAILNAGYSIDCLMARYQGVDWRSHRDVKCNGELNPQTELMNDGLLMLDPYELVFIKAKPYPIVEASLHFLKRYYDYYLDKDDLESNDFLSPRVQAVLDEKKVELQKKVNVCQADFDIDFYLRNNPDLTGAVDNTGALKHFYRNGFYERRLYRFFSQSESEECKFE